jgi:hypothetical protein
VLFFIEAWQNTASSGVNLNKNSRLMDALAVLSGRRVL